MNGGLGARDADDCGVGAVAPDLTNSAHGAGNEHTCKRIHQSGILSPTYQQDDQPATGVAAAARGSLSSSHPFTFELLQNPEDALARRSAASFSSGSHQTRRWREMDSNPLPVLWTPGFLRVLPPLGGKVDSILDHFWTPANTD